MDFQIYELSVGVYVQFILCVSRK